MRFEKDFWMRCENRIAEVCSKNSWYCKKIVDTAQAPSRQRSANSADFVIAHQFITFHVEVKSSIKYPFPMENITGCRDQNQMVRLSIERGLPILYAVFTNLDYPKFRFYSAYDVQTIVLQGGRLEIQPCVEVIDKMPNPEDLLGFYISRVRRLPEKQYVQKEACREKFRI